MVRFGDEVRVAELEGRSEAQVIVDGDPGAHGGERRGKGEEGAPRHAQPQQSRGRKEDGNDDASGHERGWRPGLPREVIGSILQPRSVRVS